MCNKNGRPVVLGDDVGADSKPVVKKEAKSNCCGACRIHGKGPATGNGQNENREGMQTLAEVTE
jgi:hypothetical protein